jgi:hypothetical protein
MTRLRRFRALAEIGCRWAADPIAHFQGGEHIIGDVPSTDIGATPEGAARSSAAEEFMQ